MSKKTERESLKRMLQDRKDAVLTYKFILELSIKDIEDISNTIKKEEDFEVYLRTGKFPE